MTAPAGHGCSSRWHAAAFACSAAFALTAAGSAHAHANGSSHLRIVANDAAAVTAEWDIDASDLELPLALDRNGDGELTGNEIQSRRAAIVRFATDRLELRRAGVPCALSVTGLQTIPREGVSWTRLSLAGACPLAGVLSIATRLFFGSPGYLALLDVETPGGRFAAALTRAGPSWHEPPHPSLSATLYRFFREGMRHVTIGYDHLAFLLLLLLPSVLRRRGSSWTPVERGREVVLDLARTVTAFTLAHSVTLALAVTGAVRIPERPVEVAIAASVVLAGLLNLWPAAAAWRLLLAAGFGLVHGFGFANALDGIAGGSARMLPMLAGFNVGIECAQLLMVGLLLPFLWLLSRRRAYVTRVMPGVSVATALTGMAWLAARL